jgi:hypothetical protein
VFSCPAADVRIVPDRSGTPDTGNKFPCRFDAGKGTGAGLASTGCGMPIPKGGVKEQ